MRFLFSPLDCTGFDNCSFGDSNYNYSTIKLNVNYFFIGCARLLLMLPFFFRLKMLLSFMH